MTIAVWKPLNSVNCVRKGYNQNGKIKRYWANTWKNVGGIKNGEATPEKVGALKNLISEKNLNVSWGNAFPQNLKEPFVRQYENKDFNHLQNIGTDILYLDFDKPDTSVTKESSLLERVNIGLSRLPDLGEYSRLGLVAFYSSSAYWKGANESEPRIHVILFLDKVYPHDSIYEWQKQFKEDILDPHTALRSQPLLVANPVFEGIEKRKIEGDQIIIRPGEKLALPKIGNTRKTTNKKTFDFGRITISKDREEWLKIQLENARKGKLDGRRGEFLFNLFQREIFYNRKNIGELLKILRNNPILYVDPKKNDRDWKDVERTYERALDYVNKRLLGTSIKDSKKWESKVICKPWLEDIDIKALPTEKCLILIKSPPFTAKSQLIEEYIKHGGFDSGIYVSTDISTIDSFTQEYPRWKSYQEGGKGKQDKQRWMPEQPWLASTEQSLTYFLREEAGQLWFPKDNPPGVVFIDEAEAVNMNILNNNSFKNVSSLYEICRRAKSVVLLDADITEEITGDFAQTLAEQGTFTRYSLVNDFDHNSHKRIQMLNSEVQAMHTIKALLDSGQTVFCHVGFSDSTEQRRLTRLYKFWSNYLKDTNAVRAYDAQNVPAELRRNPNKVIQDWLNGGLKLLIHSPWSKRSWNYNPKTKDAPQFDANVGIYPHTFFSHVNINQQDWRMRHTRQSYIYITPHKTYTPYKDIDKQEAKGLILFKDELRDQVLRSVKNRRADEKSNVKDAYMELVKRGGADLLTEFIDEPWHNEFEKSVTHLITEAGEEAREEEARKAWEKPRTRDRILNAFYRESESNEHYAPGLTKDIGFEAFKDLYFRDEKIKEEDLDDILHIWFMSEEEREHLQVDEPVTWAVMKGKLLDRIDKLVEDSFPEGINKFPEIVTLKDRDRLEIFVTQSNKGQLGRFVRENLSSLRDEIPFLLREGYGNNYLSIIEDTFDWFGLPWVKEEQYTKQEGRKIAIIQEYENLGLVKRKEGINLKIKDINENISKKIKNRENLSYREKEWLRTRGTNYTITLEDIKHRKLHNAIFREKNFSSIQHDIRFQNEKISEGLG
ncbi:MAG: hypothetical protein CBC24_03985 [Candidatus Pelagibacter sp. TMED64]|nr:MAG: hypothetical protein CBC24_03985 [Candidatus Pelagibacter sp. TMED64]